MTPLHVGRHSFAVLVLAGALFAGCSSSRPQPSKELAHAEPVKWDGSALSEQESHFHPKIGTKGMVVADDREAAEWGTEILRQGGNAIDAAVATAFAMSVTRPHHSSIGGGGFMVYCPKPDGQGRKQACVSLDYREEAPSAATRDMYLRDGKPRTDLSQNGALASGVPGVTAGLLAALEKYGTLPRRKLLSRPIRLAREGFLFTGHEESAAQDRWQDMNEETRRILGCDERGRQWGAARAGVPKAPCPPNTRLRQPELARVLEAISRRGAQGFYQGWVARKIVSGLKSAGGILTERDLAAYRPKWREPVSAEFHGMEVVSMPPPSAGGTVLLQMLGFAERADRQGALSEGYGAARTVHALTHGMALAFADRAKHFGDPDQWSVPVREMLSKEYLDARWKTFDPARANLPESAGALRLTRPANTPAVATGAGPSGERLDAMAWGEGSHTTHFSVIDREGNAVAITTTINDNFGSGFTPPGTGVVMNNEMDDFSIQPGVPNLFGLVGAEANAVGPRKRPLSSMSPTIVRDSLGNARIVVGAAGGPRITTSVFLSILNRLRFGMSLPDAVGASRFHQQWRPADLRLEGLGFPSDTQQKLIGYGYSLKPASDLARVHALERFPNGRVWGVPDVRGEGAAAAE